MSTGNAHPGSRFVLVPLVATLVAIAYLAFLVFRPFLLTFVVSASIALLLTPLHQRLSRWFGGRRGLAAGLLVTLVALTLLIPITAAAGIAANQAVTFFEWV